MRKTLTKKQKEAMQLATAINLRYTCEGKSLRNPMLTDKQKNAPEVDVDIECSEMNYLETGERRLFSMIKRIEKAMHKHKIAFDFIDGEFIVYAEMIHSEFYKNLIIGIEENNYILTDNEDNVLYVAERNDFKEVVSFLQTEYKDPFKKGQLVTRAMLVD